jgi:hypothetical protein
MVSLVGHNSVGQLFPVAYLLPSPPNVPAQFSMTFITNNKELTNNKCRFITPIPVSYEMALRPTDPSSTSHFRDRSG